MLKMNQDLQTLLLQISHLLDDQNVKELVFLCGEQLSATEKEDINDGSTLFDRLKRKGLVSKNDLSFLKEILCIIDRNDILTGKLSMTLSEITELKNCLRHISSYRLLLYGISQDLYINDVNGLKSLFCCEKPNLMNTKVSIFEVLTELEKEARLSENKLEELKGALFEIHRKDLHQKIESWEKQGRQTTYLDTTQEKTPIQENPTNQPENLKDSSGKGKNLEQYNLDKNPHGWCVILNNEDFEKAGRDEKNIQKLANRTGTKKDAEAIRRVFEKRNYIVKEHKNLIGDDLLDVMKQYGEKDHTYKDSFICFILSHGQQGAVLGVDGKEVSIKNLTNCFNGLNCQSLIGKPKVFFLQACQGDEYDKGVPYEEDSSTFENDGGSLPVTADFLTAYASTEEYVCLRSSRGSVYIQQLCKVLEDFVDEDLKSILTILHKNIADGCYPVTDYYGEHNVKQMPSYKSELRKNLILPPPGQMESH